MKVGVKNLSPVLGYPTVKTRDLLSLLLMHYQRVTDGRTDTPPTASGKR